MLTLIKRPYGRGAGSLDVLLDVSLNDFDAPSEELKALLKQCKTTKLKVGHVLQRDTPSLYFSYDHANQTAHESALLATLCMPKPEVHVSQSTGGES